MELYKPGLAPDDPLRKRKRFNQASLGLVSTLSFPVIVSTADAMLKSAEVTLVGYEKTGSGHCTAIVRGAIAEVRIAVESGKDYAQREGELLSSTIIARLRF
ncbi:MAG: BMC domain-containing protein [Moorea sp. SIO2B7]|nr:BMC domain-containing protein [Moorena sp. SIO2B7]